MFLKYEEPLYRPPSEADSLIFQITIGCSHNKCLFCEMYRSKRFRTRSIEEIERDVQDAVKYWPTPERIFLADGDPFVLSTPKLLAVVELLKAYFPSQPRISTYASPQNILSKSPDELRSIRERGISLLYFGMESGNDDVLTKVNKGATAKEMEDALKLAIDAGFDVSVTWILGLGGKKYSEQHAKDTARLLSATGARFASALTLIFLGSSAGYKKAFPEWEEISAIDSMKELKWFIENYTGPEVIFRSNHASNYLPIKGDLPKDKDKLLELLDRAIEDPQMNIRPEWSRGL